MNEKYMVDKEKVTTEIEKNGVPYIEETVYRIFNDGTKEVACTACYPKPSDEPVTPEPTEAEIAQAEMILMQAEILEKLNAMEV